MKQSKWAIVIWVLLLTGIAVAQLQAQQSTAQTEATILTVTYSEPMALTGVVTASNYSISGAGAGTLLENPTLVRPTSRDGIAFELVWEEGKMLQNGDLQLNIIGDTVTDLAGNPLDEDSWEISLPGQGIAIKPRVLNVQVSISMEFEVDVTN